MLPKLREYQRLSIALTVPFFVLLLPFLHVYSNNVTNLQLPVSWFFEDLAKFYIAIAIAIYVFLKIIPRFIGSWFAVALMFLMVVAWLQTNFFIGEFGFFTGDIPDWERDRIIHILQAILIVLLFSGFMFFSRLVINNIFFICTLLFLTSLVYLPQILENISGTNEK